MFTVASFIALAFASSALAQPGPLTPAASIEGQPCAITWTPDATGKWTQTNIQLMSGDNDNMVALTTVATVDTTSGSPATYSWTCPDVTIYSAIYFYQFSHAIEPTNLIWTTRWAIEGSGGTTVPPPNATQPGTPGAAIPWGNGALKDPSTAKPAPSYITDQTSASGSSTSNSTTSVIASSSAVSSVTATSQSSIATVVVKTATVTSATSATDTTSAAATSTATAGGSSASGAGLTRSQGSIVAAVVGAVAAGLFVTM